MVSVLMRSSIEYPPSKRDSRNPLNIHFVLKSSQHEKGSLGAFDQVKVKYSSSKSDSRNSLIINNLLGAS